MNRRTFLRRLGAAAVALTLARHLPGIAPMPLAVPSPPVVGAVLQRGDVFTIAGRYIFHPQTGKPIPGVLQHFVVTADVTSDVIPREDIWLGADHEDLGDVPVDQVQIGW